jgi:hypothetical protein
VQLLLIRTLQSKTTRQTLPLITCLILFGLFTQSSASFITQLINPFSAEKIQLHIQPFDVGVGFFLYFVTAVDYALIVGRMQVTNSGSKARFVMNVFTCLGCFMGVSLVLFLWGFAKEIDWLITAMLIFAGSVMIKLAFEGIEYFRNDAQIWRPLRLGMAELLTFLHHFTEGLTFWIPELGSPKIERMSLVKLAKWSFLLPFIIGLDDFVGYMGAMTVYNVFSLLIGIFFADAFIDVLIFTSPKLTKKLVESALLSLLASFAFLYLMYQSYAEAAKLVLHAPSSGLRLTYSVLVACLVAYLLGYATHHHWGRLVKFKHP